MTSQKPASPWRQASCVMAVVWAKKALWSLDEAALRLVIQEIYPVYLQETWSIDPREQRRVSWKWQRRLVSAAEVTKA